MAGISIDDMAEEIMDGLQEYSELADSAMKKAVQKTASQVRKEISENAPERTGKYGKSWAAKKVAEKSHSLQIVVHSRNRYQIAHLLEHGHAKRNGGRVEAQPHIAPAEEHGAENFDKLLKKYLS
ncbi:MAG: HK97 gp10 family phage protein [Oscillospiraceae bacterium]|nr:HK97 gp10 family phage protein [Oscillospiraceae bacterium]